MHCTAPRYRDESPNTNLSLGTYSYPSATASPEVYNIPAGDALMFELHGAGQAPNQFGDFRGHERLADTTNASSSVPRSSRCPAARLPIHGVQRIRDEVCEWYYHNMQREFHINDLEALNEGALTLEYSCSSVSPRRGILNVSSVRADFIDKVTRRVRLNAGESSQPW